jgi:hypothetical protein
MAKAGAEDEDLITQAEAARLRGVTRSAITYLIAQGRLKTHERYGVPFLSRAEVLAYEPQKPGPKPKAQTETTERLNAAFRKATETNGKTSKKATQPATRRGRKVT